MNNNASQANARAPLYREAWGLYETTGLANHVIAIDAMLKAAAIKIVSRQQVTAGIITTIIQGDVASVRIALQTAQKEAPQGFRAAHLIPQPWDETLEWSKPRTLPTVTCPPLESLQAMTVIALRRLARQLPDFPLKGRQVSHASKQVLLDNFELRQSIIDGS